MHCPRSFSQGNDLKAHIRRHTGERYNCDQCSSSFIQLYLLNNHKKNVHGIEAKSAISRVSKFGSSDYDETTIPHTETQFKPDSEATCSQYAPHQC